MTRVYAAERDVFGARLYSAEHGVTIEQAQAVVDRHAVGVVVERGQGHRSRCDYKRSIVLGRLAGLPTVLHETAHALTPDDKGHGAAFQAALLRLVDEEMSHYWGVRLRAALRRHKPRGYVTALRRAA